MIFVSTIRPENDDWEEGSSLTNQIIMMTIKEWRDCEILAEKDTINFIKALKEDNENVEDTDHKIMNRMKELQEKHRITDAFACKEVQRLTELGFEFGEQELLRNSKK